MNIEQIAALATSGESETLEFKATTGMRREAVMTVCAFLNQGGGQVLFGVTQNGAVAGQQVSERTIEELSAELRLTSTLRRFRRSSGSLWTADVKSSSSARVRERQGRTPTAAAPTVGSGTLRWPCPPTSTTGCSSSGCTASSVGRTSPPPGGRSTTSTWRRFAGLSRRRSGAGGLRSL